MRHDWSRLDAELEHWAQSERTVQFFWRDDDAIAPSDQLSRLAAMAAHHGVPVHLAVIPARATDALATFVHQTPQLIPLVHGWAHENHARAGTKKAEFGPDRPVAACLADALRGKKRLEGLFGAGLLPVFVPPWNRISPDVIRGLPEAGFRVLSTFGPRTAEYAAPGLREVNTHIDPIDWRASRTLLPVQGLIDNIAGLLAARRSGLTSDVEPLGLLTHHLIHDADIWSFCDALIEKFCRASFVALRLCSDDAGGRVK